jgi:hypothetical protein
MVNEEARAHIKNKNYHPVQKELLSAGMPILVMWAVTSHFSNHRFSHHTLPSDTHWASTCYVLTWNAVNGCQHSDNILRHVKQTRLDWWLFTYDITSSHNSPTDELHLETGLPVSKTLGKMYVVILYVASQTKSSTAHTHTCFLSVWCSMVNCYRE